MTLINALSWRALQFASITALLLIASTDSNAQYGRRNSGTNMVAQYFAMRANGDAGGMKIFQRYEFGVTKTMFSGKVSHNFQYMRGNKTMVDTSISMEMHAQSWGISDGLFFPLGKMGEKSIVALYWGQIGNVHFLKSDSVYFEHPQDASQREGFAHEGLSIQIGMPIGLDYKYGGEALLDKAERVSYTVGMGIMPSFSQTLISDWLGVGSPGTELEFAL